MLTITTTIKIIKNNNNTEVNFSDALSDFLLHLHINTGKFFFGQTKIITPLAETAEP